MLGRRFGFDVERGIFLTVLHRLMGPGSDRAAERWKADYAPPGTEAIGVHKLHRAMHWLRAPLPVAQQAGATPVAPRTREDRTEEALFARRRDLLNGSLHLVFCDTTTVGHFPPRTSKWNRIEHGLFSHVAMDWPGTSLVDLATVVNLIGSTHTRSALRVRSDMDRRRDPSRVTITDAQMARSRLEPHRFHGDWNYTIHPAAGTRSRSAFS